MKKFLIVLSSFFLLLINTEKSFASHAVGADLTYQCLGGNNYRFFFVFYRDCAGIQVLPSYTINGSSSCGGSVVITVNQDSTHEINNTCPSVVSQCVNPGSAFMGIEANYYHGDVLLPSGCNFWTFGVTPICNRNIAINNLDPNGTAYCLYVKATLDNDAGQCNSSPVFESVPVQFLCAYQIQYYMEHAYDVDGDSLVYEMITPHSDTSTDVQYIPGLSGTQPVTYLSPTLFNPQTGDVRFNADGAQVTVIAIQVNEYRNGILIGSVERDIELLFENCTNNLPLATGFNGTNNYSMHVCADSVFSIHVNTADPDSTQQTFLTWNYGISGAIFSTSNTYRDTGYVYWLPGINDISAQPYIFTATVMDNACPYFGVSSLSYAVFVDSCFSTDVFSSGENNIQFFSANYENRFQTIRYKYRLNKESSINISLFDLTGRELQEVKFEKTLQAEKILDISNLASGIYILNLKTGDGISKAIRIVAE